MEDIISYYSERMTLKMRETEENFIFEYISPFLEMNYKCVIPKVVLKKALLLYMEKCPEEFKALIEEAEKMEG